MLAMALPGTRFDLPTREGTVPPVNDDHLCEYWPGDTSPSVVAALRKEFPGYQISREVAVGQVRYVACRRHPGTHPHTVMSADPDKLRAWLRTDQA
jgi:hypothetical protein